MKTMKYFYNRENLFEFISYFVECKHFKLDILFCRTPGTIHCCKTRGIAINKIFDTRKVCN